MQLVIGTKLGDLNSTLDFGFMTQEFNLTKLILANFNESDQEAMIQLGDDLITLSIPELNFNLTSSEYFVISDPPVFADLGAFYFTIGNMTVNMKSKPYMKDHHLQVKLDQMALQGDGINFDFDGLSDFSIWVSETLDMFTNVIFGRIASMVKYSLHETFEPLMNDILAIIPSEIPIDDDLDFHMGLSHDPVYNKNYLSMPFAFELTSKEFPVPFPQPDVLPLHVDNEYQFTLSISQYMLDSGLYLMHKEGLLQIDINSTKNSTVLTTDDLSYAMPELELYFNSNQSCNIRLSTEESPMINLTHDEQSFVSKILMQFDCWNNTVTPAHYSEAAIVEAVINTTFNMSLHDNLTFILHINEMHFDFIKVIHSNVGDVLIGVIDTVIDSVTPVITVSINAILDHGIAIYPIIKPYADMIYLDLSKIDMINEDGYMQMLITPIFEVGNQEEVQDRVRSFKEQIVGQGFHLESIEQILRKEFFRTRVSQLLGLVMRREEFAYLSMPFVSKSQTFTEMMKL